MIMCTPPTYRLVKLFHQSHSEVLMKITVLLQDGKLRLVKEMDRHKFLEESTVDWVRARAIC